MNVYEGYRLVNYISDKDFSGNTLKPDDYNLLLEVVNINLFELEFENMVAVSQRENKPMDKIIYDSKSLSRFVTRKDNVAISSGEMIVQKDYRENVMIFKRDARSPSTSYGKRIETVSYDEFVRRNESIIELYIEDHPVAVYQNRKFEIYPANISKIDHVYLRLPSQPVFAYTVSTIGQEVYDAGNSTQLEWDEWMHYKFYMLILKEMGINLRENQVIEYAQLEMQNHSK